MKTLIALAVLFSSSVVASMDVPTIPKLDCMVNVIDNNGKPHSEYVSTTDSTFSDFSIMGNHWVFTKLDENAVPVMTMYIPIGFVQGHVYMRNAGGDVTAAGKVSCSWK